MSGLWSNCAFLTGCVTVNVSPRCKTLSWLLYLCFIYLFKQLSSYGLFKFFGLFSYFLSVLKTNVLFQKNSDVVSDFCSYLNKSGTWKVQSNDLYKVSP